MRQSQNYHHFGRWPLFTINAFDLDATIIASGKRACLYTCRAAVPGERGYQPLIAFCPETVMVPWLEARDGNVPAKLDNRRALEEALWQLPGAVRHVTLRTDGAGCQESVFRACNDPGVRSGETRLFGTIGLICSAMRSDQLMAEVAQLADDAWHPLETGPATARANAPQLECAELPYVPATGYGLKLHATWRPAVPFPGNWAWIRANCRQHHPGRRRRTRLTPNPDAGKISTPIRGIGHCRC